MTLASPLLLNQLAASGVASLLALAALAVLLVRGPRSANVDLPRWHQTRIPCLLGSLHLPIVGIILSLFYDVTQM